MKPYSDDPDTTVVDPEDHTVIGLPAPARLPASPPQAPGAGYLRRYPVRLDPPLILEHRVDGIDWSARVHVLDPSIVPHLTRAGREALGGVLCGCARCKRLR